MARRTDTGCLSAVVACVLILCLVGVQAYNIWHFVDKAAKVKPAEPVTPAAIPPPVPLPDDGNALPPTPARADLVSADGGVYIRDRSLQVTGYYKPEATVAFGAYALTHVRFGARVDFSAVETNHRTTNIEPPFTLVFDKVSSPLSVGMLREKPVRVVCSNYTVTRDLVKCEGDDATLGGVSFKGRFSPLFVGKIAVEGASRTFYQETALTGDLTIDGVTARDIDLAYWAEE